MPTTKICDKALNFGMNLDPDGFPHFRTWLSSQIPDLENSPAGDAWRTVRPYALEGSQLATWIGNTCGSKFEAIIAELQPAAAAGVAAGPAPTAADVLNVFLTRLLVQFKESVYAQNASAASIKQTEHQSPPDFWLKIQTAISLTNQPHKKIQLIERALSNMHPIYEGQRQWLMGIKRDDWPEHLGELIAKCKIVYQNRLDSSFFTAATSSHTSSTSAKSAPRARTGSPGRVVSFSDASSSHDFHCDLHGANPTHDTADCRALRKSREASPARPQANAAVHDHFGSALLQLQAQLSRLSADMQALRPYVANTAQTSTHAGSSSVSRSPHLPQQQQQPASSASSSSYGGRGGQDGYDSRHGGRGGQHAGGRGGRGGGRGTGRGTGAWCNYCEKRGHTEEDCWTKHPDRNPYRKTTSTPPREGVPAPARTASAAVFSPYVNAMYDGTSLHDDGTFYAHTAVLHARLSDAGSTDHQGDSSSTASSASESSVGMSELVESNSIIGDMPGMVEEPEGDFGGLPGLETELEEEEEPVDAGSTAMQGNSNSGTASTSGMTSMPRLPPRPTPREPLTASSTAVAMLSMIAQQAAAYAVMATVVRQEPPISFVPAQLSANTYPPTSTAKPARQPDDQADESDWELFEATLAKLAKCEQRMLMGEGSKIDQRLIRRVLNELGRITRSLQVTVVPAQACVTVNSKTSILQRTAHGALYTVSRPGKPPPSITDQPRDVTAQQMAKNPEVAAYLCKPQYLFYFPVSTVALLMQGTSIPLEGVLYDKGANVNLITHRVVQRKGLPWEHCSHAINTSAGPEVRVLGRLLTVDIRMTLLPGTQHEVRMPLKLTLVVEKEGVFDFLMGNEQMQHMADAVMPFPQAHMEFSPNLLLEPEYRIRIRMEPAYTSGVTLSELAACSSVYDLDTQQELPRLAIRGRSTTPRTARVTRQVSESPPLRPSAAAAQREEERAYRSRSRSPMAVPRPVLQPPQYAVLTRLDATFGTGTTNMQVEYANKSVSFTIRLGETAVTFINTSLRAPYATLEGLLRLNDLGVQFEMQLLPPNITLLEAEGICTRLAAREARTWAPGTVNSELPHYRYAQVTALQATFNSTALQSNLQIDSARRVYFEFAWGDNCVTIPTYHAQFAAYLSQDELQIFARAFPGLQYIIPARPGDFVVATTTASSSATRPMYVPVYRSTQATSTSSAATYAPTARSAAGRSSASQRPDTCSYCLRPGHSAADCWVKYPERAPLTWRPKEDTAAYDLVFCKRLMEVLEVELTPDGRMVIHSNDPGATASEEPHGSEDGLQEEPAWVMGETLEAMQEQRGVQGGQTNPYVQVTRLVHQTTDPLQGSQVTILYGEDKLRVHLSGPGLPDLHFHTPYNHRPCILHSEATAIGQWADVSYEVIPSDARYKTYGTTSTPSTPAYSAGGSSPPSLSSTTYSTSTASGSIMARNTRHNLPQPTWPGNPARLLWKLMVQYLWWVVLAFAAWLQPMVEAQPDVCTVTIISWEMFRAHMLCAALAYLASLLLRACFGHARYIRGLVQLRGGHVDMQGGTTRATSSTATLLEAQVTATNCSLEVINSNVTLERSIVKVSGTSGKVENCIIQAFDTTIYANNCRLVNVHNNTTTVYGAHPEDTAIPALPSTPTYQPAPRPKHTSAVYWVMWLCSFFSLAVKPTQAQDVATAQVMGNTWQFWGTVALVTVAASMACKMIVALLLLISRKLRAWAIHYRNNRRIYSKRAPTYRPPKRFAEPYPCDTYAPSTPWPRHRTVRNCNVQARQSPTNVHNGTVYADKCNLDIYGSRTTLLRCNTHVDAPRLTDVRESSVYTYDTTVYVGPKCRVVQVATLPLRLRDATSPRGRRRNNPSSLWSTMMLWITSCLLAILPTARAQQDGPVSTWPLLHNALTRAEHIYLALVAAIFAHFLRYVSVKVLNWLTSWRMYYRCQTAWHSAPCSFSKPDWSWPNRSAHARTGKGIHKRDTSTTGAPPHCKNEGSYKHKPDPPQPTPSAAAPNNNTCASAPADTAQGGEDCAAEDDEEDGSSKLNRCTFFLRGLVNTATSRRKWYMPACRQGRRRAVREVIRKRKTSVMTCCTTTWNFKRLSALLMILLCMVSGVACTGAASGTALPSETLQSLVATLAVGGFLLSQGIRSANLAQAVDGISFIHPDGEASLIPSARYEKDPNNGWIWGNAKDMTPEEQSRLRSEVSKRRDLAFAFDINMPGYNGELGPFRIDLDTDGPIFQAPRRMSEAERAVAKEKTDELLPSGIVTPCTSGAQYACNSVIAAKKDADTGMWTDKRMAQDYRRINKHTPPDKYGLHRPEDIFQRVGKSKYFTKLDMRQGFLQIPILPEHQSRTAYWLGNQLMMYTRMPYGLKNAPAKFQRVMDFEISKAGLDHCAVAFIDDLLIYSNTAEEHIAQVAAVLDMLHACGLRAHPGKSIFGADAVEYLGHNISCYGMQPHEAKVAAVKELKAPANVSELRALLGFVNYYRCYVPNFSALVCPLNMLLRKDVPWMWGNDQEVALEAVKTALTTEGLALRRIDYSRPLILHTDWSIKGIGAVLGQKDDDGNEYMCACISRSLNKHEKNYSSYKGEMLAAVWAIKTLRHHLHGNAFKLITDHSPLTYILTSTNLTGQYARWSLALQEFEFEIEHRPGVKHQNADVLSRFPRDTTADYTGARLDHEHSNAELADPVGNRVATFTRQRARMDFQLMQSHMRAPAGKALSWIDDHCPTPNELLAGHNGLITDPIEVPPDHDDEVLSQRREQLALRANAWVHAAKQRLDAVKPSAPLPLRAQRDTQGSVTQCTSLDTTILPNTFYDEALQSGVLLYEPFGGMCAGLEMCLRNGIKIRQYLYSDSCEAARTVAIQRMLSLSAAYPTLLPPEALEDAFVLLPQDVAQVTYEHIRQAVNAHPYQWLVVAGWPCQDLSAAGAGAGLKGSRSNLFFDLLRVLGSLQVLQPSRPPAYLLENAPMQIHPDPFIRQEEFFRICKAIGEPVLLDAAAFGAHAYRLRNFWTNIADTANIEAVYQGVRRPASRIVSSILDACHEVKLSTGSNPPPYCQCNVRGQPIRVLPTLVAHPNSYAFREDGPGMLFNKHTGEYEQPNIEERERALGYETGSTAAQGVTSDQRHTLTGNCMDATCMESLMAICCAHNKHLHGAREVKRIASVVVSMANVYGLAGGLAVLTTLRPEDTPKAQDALADLAELQDTQAQPQGSADIWDDATTLYYLRTRLHEPGTTAGEQRRVLKRARQYMFQSDQVYRIMADGTRRQVPKPADRVAIVKSMHEETGHFGIRRTTALLQTSYWWTGMRRDAKAVVRHCSTCDRIRATFNHQQPTLQPLPIVGLFYRWGTDLAGPFEETKNGHKYVMVCVEHFSKYAIFIPLKDKTADCTTFAFLHHVLGRYGACAELVSDQGGEWKASFTELMAQSLIDHRFTSPNHPQANGLSERAVQTCKRALRKLVEASGQRDNWDLLLPYIMLGYNCSTQESTKFSPYQLMHSIAPTVPPAIKERFEPTLCFDTDEAMEAAAESLKLRTAALQRNLTIAGNNLLVAQQRDTLRYATLRGGSYHPRLRRFETGDYVYYRNTTKLKSLEPKARPDILRVKEVRPSGVLVLQGRCGGTLTVHAIHCAPCHLMMVDHDVNIHLGRPSATHSCEVCKYPDDEHVMLLCDECNSGWHTFCLTPPLEAVPAGLWICPKCTEAGVTHAQVQTARDNAAAEQHVARPATAPLPVTPEVPTSMQPFHARALRQSFLDPANGKPRVYKGITEYAGKRGSTHYFNIRYDDGDFATKTLAQLKLLLDDSDAAERKPLPSTSKAATAAKSDTARPVSAPARAESTTGRTTRNKRNLVAASVHADWDEPMMSNRHQYPYPRLGPQHEPAWRYDSGEALANILKYFMPGDTGDTDFSAWSAILQAGPTPQAASFNPQSCEICLPSLMRSIDFSRSVDIYDPWSCTSSIEAYFRRGGYVVRQPGLRTSQHSPLLPQHYLESRRAGLKIDVIVTRPWEASLDLFLPMAIRHARTAVCAYVPATYVLDAPPYRRAWLRRLQHAEQLCVIIGVPDLSGGHAAAWLCFYRHGGLYRLSVKGESTGCNFEIA